MSHNQSRRYAAYMAHGGHARSLIDPLRTAGSVAQVVRKQVRATCLNGKNSLFVGNERAGRTAAILSSLASTRRRHDIDPQRSLTQLLINLPVTPMSQLQRWLPDEWKRRDTLPPPG